MIKSKLIKILTLPETVRPSLRKIETLRTTTMAFTHVVCTLAVLTLTMSQSGLVAGAELMYTNDVNEKCYHSSWSSGKPCRYPCTCNSATDKCEIDYANVHKSGLLRPVSDQKDHESSLIFAMVHALDDRRLIYSEKDEGGRTPLESGKQSSLRYFLKCSQGSNRAFLNMHEEKVNAQVMPDENLYAYDKDNTVECKTTKGTKIRNTFRYKDILYTGDKKFLEEHVKEFGPTVVRIKAHPTMFLSTTKVEDSHHGRFKGRSELGDHYVEIVGLESGRYFVVKNSWGPNWGENGYWKVGIRHFIFDYYLPGQVSGGRQRIPMVTMDIESIMKVEQSTNTLPARRAVERRKESYGSIAGFHIKTPSGDDLHKFMESYDEDHDMAKLKAALRAVKAKVGKSNHKVIALHHADVTLAAGRKFYVVVITEKKVHRSDWLQTYVFAGHVWIPFPGYGAKHSFDSIRAHRYEDAESDGGYIYYKITPDLNVGKDGFAVIHKRDVRATAKTTTATTIEAPGVYELMYYVLAGSVGISMIMRATISPTLTNTAKWVVYAFVLGTSASEVGRLKRAFTFLGALMDGDLYQAFWDLGHCVVAINAPFTGPVNVLKSMIQLAPIITGISLVSFVAFLAAVWTDVDTRWELVRFLHDIKVIERRVLDDFANWEVRLWPKKKAQKEKSSKRSKRGKLLGGDGNIEGEKAQNVAKESDVRKRIRGD